MKYFLMTDERP